MGVTKDIWVLELARGTWTRLTFGGFNTLPVWSPDGERLYFWSIAGESSQVFWVPTDGSSGAQQLTKGVNSHVPISMSPDGKSLLIGQRDDGGSWDIGLLRLEEGSEPEILLATPFDEYYAMIAPNGRWLAYVSNESGQDEVYVRPFPDMGTKWRISTQGGIEPQWSSDGTELYYRNGHKILAVSIQTRPSFTPGRPSEVFEDPQWVIPKDTWNYDVTADGQHFLILRPEKITGHKHIRVVQNWFEELRRLVPSN
jgi:Tol biopolymer transport system component